MLRSKDHESRFESRFVHGRNGLTQMKDNLAEILSLIALVAIMVVLVRVLV
jgi:hypothetical protein